MDLGQNSILDYLEGSTLSILFHFFPIGVTHFCQVQTLFLCCRSISSSCSSILPLLPLLLLFSRSPRRKSQSSHFCYIDMKNKDLSIQLILQVQYESFLDLIFGKEGRRRTKGRVLTTATFTTSVILIKLVEY